MRFISVNLIFIDIVGKATSTVLFLFLFKNFSFNLQRCLFFVFFGETLLKWFLSTLKLSKRKQKVLTVYGILVQVFNTFLNHFFF